jgi:hypothetical protein
MEIQKVIDEDEYNKFERKYELLFNFTTSIAVFERANM